MLRKILLFCAALVAALHYSLMPVGNRGRNTWLPGKWAEWVDMNDWWLNFWAFVVFAGGVVWMLGRARPAWYRLLVATSAGGLLAVAIETAQFAIPGRYADPGDLTAALFGSVVGGSLAGWTRLLSWIQSRCGSQRHRDEARPMRICFLDQTGQLGGAELMLLDLASAFQERGLAEVEVILFGDGPFREALEARGVPCRVEPLGQAAAEQTKEAGGLGWARALPSGWGLVRRLARRIRESDADVLYSNTAKALLAGWVASAWTGRPLIHHLHDILDPAHFSAANRWILVQAANWGARRVIVNSDATGAAFVAAGGRPELVVTIPNGFDLSRFADPGEEARARARAGWGLATGGGGSEGARDPDWGFGVFGRLTEWKGQHIFLEALAQVPEARGVIVGAALFTAEDRAYEERLRERAASPDLAGRLVFTGFQADIVGMMHAVDAVVHCSTCAEPFGRVIVEAQLCGRPVVVSRAGGAAEIVTHGDTGWQVTPGDAGDLAERMRWILEHPAESQEVARKGQAQARERYGLEAVVARTAEVVRSAESGKRNAESGKRNAESGKRNAESGKRNAE